MSRSRGRNRGRSAITGRPAVRAYTPPGQALDLGDLSGEVVEPVYATFVYFGERYRVNPDLTETLVVDLLAEAATVPVDDPRSAGRSEPSVAQNAEKSKDYVRQHVHPEDFDAMWAAAKANRQPMESLLALCWRLLSLVTDRPTMPPSDSSDGRPATNQNSPDGASSRDDDEAAIDGSWWPEDLPRNESAIRVVEQFEARGRPDLANQIMVTQEARAAASAARTG
jgi:hypothetical protein